MFCFREELCFLKVVVVVVLKLGVNVFKIFFWKLQRSSALIEIL